MLTLFSLQTQFNNSINIVIHLIFNEINYNFKIREALSNLTKQKITSFVDVTIKILTKNNERFNFYEC